MIRKLSALFLASIVASASASAKKPVKPPPPPPPPPPIVVGTPAGPVAVLMYHEIVPDALNPVPSDTVVKVSTFNAQMAALKAAGYTAVTINQVLQHMRGEVILTGKPIAITFDDGWNNQQNAIPALNENGFKATFNIVAGFPGNGLSYMSWANIRSLSTANHDIASHSHSHPMQMTLSSAVTEVLTSKNIIESQLGKPVTSFAWPGGYFTDPLTQYAKDVGYRGAQSIDDNWCMKANLSLEGTTSCLWKTGNNTGQDPYLIKRIFVDGRCTTTEFMTQVSQQHASVCYGTALAGTSTVRLAAAPSTLTVNNATNDTAVRPLRDQVDKMNDGKDHGRGDEHALARVKTK